MNPAHPFGEEDSPSFDETWEHQENLAEAGKMLRLTVESLQQSPQLAQELVNAQRQAFEAMSGGVINHVCGLCRRKREFVALVQMMAIEIDLRTGQTLGPGLLTCAFRTPVTHLPQGGNLVEMSAALARWYYDEALPTTERTIPQPAWYSKDAMEDDGHG